MSILARKHPDEIGMFIFFRPETWPGGGGGGGGSLSAEGLGIAWSGSTELNRGSSYPLCIKIFDECLNFSNNKERGRIT